MFFGCNFGMRSCFCVAQLKRLQAPRQNTQGVVSMWHIENFEGGSGSRHQFLLKQMIALEKHKGLLVSIQTLTKAQAQDQIEREYCPIW